MWVGVGGQWARVVQDEFSEYLLETRFLTSANFNTHPLRIFFLKIDHFVMYILLLFFIMIVDGSR